MVESEDIINADILNGKNGDEDTLQNIHLANRSRVVKQKEFSSLMAEIEKLPIEDKKKELEMFLQDVNQIALFSSDELMSLFVEFRKIKSFSNMIKLYKISVNEEFKNSIMVKEQLMVAYNKTGDMQASVDLGCQLIEEGVASGDVYGAVGKAYYSLSKGETDIESRKQLLKDSINFYKIGFEKYMEFYPGINVAYKMIELAGLEEGNEAKETLARAGEIAQVVYYCTLKEGANETKDYWCAATRLEAACIASISNNSKLDGEIDRALNYLSKFKMESWGWETTIDSMKNLNKFAKSGKIEYVISKLSEFKENSTDKKVEVSAGYDDKMNSIVASSYNYRGLASNFEGASSVGGNMKYGGQLPDHTVSRKDVEFMDTILNTPLVQLFPNEGFNEVFGEEISQSLNSGNLKMNDINDVNLFLKVIDKFIRYHFGTENFAETGLNLENNAEINNSVYDQTVSSVIKFFGKDGDRTVDSRTNISVLFTLGMGDCRHHAQVKQLLFDRWQEKKMDSILTKMYKGEVSPSQGIVDFNDIYRLQLRTIDVNITLPIQLGGEKSNEMYNPVKEDGKYVVQEGQKNPLEEHTMTILLRTDENGCLEDARIADAFYQHTYDWQNYSLDIDKDISVDENGHYVINAGTISAKKVVGDVELPVVISPTVYAGKRDVVSKDEIGSTTKLLGIDCPINDIVISLSHRDYMVKLLGKIRNCVKVNVKTTNDNSIE